MSDRTITRTEFRANQRKYLEMAQGDVVVEIIGDGKSHCIVSGEYLSGLFRQMRSARETIEVVLDRKLFSQIMAVRDTLDDDLRTGMLHSFEEVMSDER